MEPQSKLNTAALSQPSAIQGQGVVAEPLVLNPPSFCGRRAGGWIILLIALSTGLLYGRLSMLYVPTPSMIQPQAETVEAKPPRQREDAELFDRALAMDLLRLDRAGRIEVAPADLPLRRRWASDHPDLLTPSGNEPDWLTGPWDEEVSRWHRALHFSASGRYVRQQIDLFNARQPEFPHIQLRNGRLVWRDRP